jgi:hypothetical protein
MWSRRAQLLLSLKTILALSATLHPSFQTQGIENWSDDNVTTGELKKELQPALEEQEKSPLTCASSSQTLMALLISHLRSMPKMELVIVDQKTSDMALCLIAKTRARRRATGIRTYLENLASP